MEFLDEGGKTPYEVLGLEKGSESTADEIKKAYRRLALIKHPDKAKTPNAAAEFAELQKAYAVLTDSNTRAALDDYLSAKTVREERYAQQDSKRRKMREDLEKRERTVVRERSEEEKAKARLKEELDHLRQRAMAEQQQTAAAARQAAAKAATAAAAAPSARTPPPAAAAAAAAAAPVDETTELLMRTVKVSWDPAIGEYTSDQIRAAFSSRWGVEDVILKEPKKKKGSGGSKASALVVLSSVAEAAEAAQEVCGSAINPLLVVPYFKVVPGATQVPDAQQLAPGRSFDSSGGGGGVQQRQGRRQSPDSGSPLPPRSSLQQPDLTAASLRQNPPGRPLFPAAAVASGLSKPAGPLFPSAGGGGQPAAAAGKPAFPAGGGSFSGSSFPGSSSNGSSFPGGPAFSSFPGLSSAPAAGAGGSGGGAAAVPGAGGFESSVLEKMRRRAEERERLLKQIEEEEGKGKR